VEDNPLSSGITFSGGEPFLYASQLAVLARAVHALGKDVWSFSGWTYEWLSQNEHAKALLDNVDVLVDGPFLLAERDLTLKFRGSRNQRVIDMKATREAGKIVLKYED
jgi:anaerobic ribonucleoside-triphosphate reductase activating protein